MLTVQFSKVSHGNNLKFKISFTGCFKKDATIFVSICILKDISIMKSSPGFGKYAY